MDLYQVCLPGEDYNFENAKNNAWYKLKKIDLSNIAFMFPSLKIAEKYQCTKLLVICLKSKIQDWIDEIEEETYFK